jgi:hypothetical protein
MSAPAKLNFKVYQGATFNEVLRWESAVKVYVPITTIQQSAPLVVTVPNHGIPNDWRVKFTNIAGMTELNSLDTYHQVSEATTNTITINNINSIGYKPYTTGGIVEYNKPVDISGYTARMQIRSKVDSVNVILELTSLNSGIVINNINKSITINISAEVSSTFTFNNAVYSLEMVSSGGQVTPVISGSLTLVKEVTR